MRVNCGQWLVLLSLLQLSQAEISAAEWQVPLAGNTWRTEPGPGGGGVSRRGEVYWTDPAEVYSVFIRVDRAADLRLQLRAAAGNGARLAVQAAGLQQTLMLRESAATTYDLGVVQVADPGYVQIRLQGLTAGTGDSGFGRLQELLVSSATADLQLDYVRNNEGGMFYWGRRGPSVHLSYRVPSDRDLEYAYSEIRVPEGDDPIGTFYMANGFGEGYFGMQVNSVTERRVLFSVWSPFQTDNPRDIPEDQRIELLARGPEVVTGEFGNEGSGGQSFLRFPWQSGRRYGFLTQVQPDGKGSTIYTSWFGDLQAGEWRLIAKFRRPHTETHLRRFHSFLESFSPDHGYLGRRGLYGNIRVRDTAGAWHECTGARFSVDATGAGRHRLDFLGGVEGQQFFLQNCGFFAMSATVGSEFEITGSGMTAPEVNLEQLQRSAAATP